jgi:LPS export ABC transporter permease LptG
MWGANVLLAALGLVLFYLREQSEGLDPGILLPQSVRNWVSAGFRKLREVRGAPTSGRPEFGGSTEEDFAEELETRRPRFLVLITLLAVAVVASIFITPFLMVGLALVALVYRFSTTLDRFVLRRFLAVLAGCVVTLFTLVLVYEFIQLLDDLVQRGQPASLALVYMGYRIPWVLSQILPMSCLTACLLTFGIMARFNEVTAVKASGTSIYRLSMPVVISSLALSIVAYVNYDYIVPYANQKSLQVKDTIRGRSPRSYQPGDQRWVFGADGRLYNFTHYVAPPFPVLPAAGAGTFQGFSIYFLDPATYEITGRVYARRASFESGQWVLREGWQREFRESGETFERFAQKSFDFPEGPGFFIKEWKSPEQMTFAELRRLVAELRRRGYDTQELRVDLYSKTSFPLVPLTLVIIGLPFCFRMGRRGSMYGVGVAILVAALYFLTFSATSALGGAGLMPAFLASWVPNILFAGTGAYLLLKTAT